MDNIESYKRKYRFTLKEIEELFVKDYLLNTYGQTARKMLESLATEKVLLEKELEEKNKKIEELQQELSNAKKEK